jgi:hypothetical protein
VPVVAKHDQPRFFLLWGRPPWAASCHGGQEGLVRLGCFDESGQFGERIYPESISLSICGPAAGILGAREPDCQFFR